MKPVFSIITCTFNSEKYILKNLQSVIGQTCQDYEHLIVDGYSKDKTIEILRKFQKSKETKIRLVQSEAKGISNAFNTGIKNSSGKYLFFLNSDDCFYDRNVLQSVCDFLERNSVDWCYGKIQVVEENGQVLGLFPKYKLLQTANKQLLKFINFIPHQAVFINREVIEQFGGFDEQLINSMDYEYYLRIANQTKWIYFDKIIAKYLIHKGSTSSSLINRQKNIAIFENIQSKYLNRGDMLVAKIINFLVDKYNITYR